MYGFTTLLTDVSFEQALAKTTEALKVEGFGVLSDIDVQRAMKARRVCASLGGRAAA